MHYILFYMLDLVLSTELSLKYKELGPSADGPALTLTPIVIFSLTPTN